MRVIFAVVVLGALGCSRGATTVGVNEAAIEPTSPVPREATQLVTVITEDWNAFRGTLRRYERVREDGWVEIGVPIAVVIGREGYGWGRGLHEGASEAERDGPTKHEGDGRSPAGVFRIGNAYGYASSIEGITLPYAPATPALRCVDDPRSSHYNEIVSIDETRSDWQSAEHMRRDDELYTITIVVEHNLDPPTPGAGSCIFLHVWIDGDTGMSGCTAMPLQSLETLAAWLRPNTATLVALPATQYKTHQTAWSLP
ncbi:MAG: L,D-transpeptidase family protein [Polyangiales bacterium]